MKLFDDTYIETIIVSADQKQALAEIVSAYFSSARVLLVRQIDNFNPAVIEEIDVQHDGYRPCSAEGRSAVKQASVTESIICSACGPVLETLLHDNRLEPIALDLQQLNSFSRRETFSQGWIYPVSLDEFAHVWCLILTTDDTSIQPRDEHFRLQIELFCTRLALKKRTDVLQEARTWIDKELGEMSRVQHLLLPDNDLKIPGVELAFRFKVYRSSGGDYIDITSLDRDRPEGEPHAFGAIIADVTGHGPSATIEAVMLDAILRTYKPAEPVEGPGSVLSYINQHFFTRRERGRFVTAFLFNYLPESRTLRYACAGHPHGYIKRGREVIRLDQGSIPVGIMPDFEWDTYQIPVQQGDILFMYTDVVIETRDARGEEFGFDRLESVVADSGSCPHRVVDNVEQALQHYSGRRSFDDDLTLCCIQITH